MALLNKTIPSSVMDPIPYKCEICKDSGWIHSKDENGYQYSKPCKCRLVKEAEERLANSGLAGSIKKQTFDSFIVDNEMRSKIKKTAKEYLSVLSDPLDSLFCLYTDFCTAICGEILKQNIGVRYMQWLDESRRLKAKVNDENFEDQVSEYIDVSLLYIDDLLKQKYSPNPAFTESDIKIAFTILNARYLRNKPTIISSEWDLINQLLPADEGVFSRVYERCKGYTVYINRDPNTISD